MGRPRWIPRLGPPLVAAAALALAGGSSLAGPRAAGTPPDCPEPDPSPTIAADPLPGAWFRQDPVLDASGALAGQRLAAGRLGGLSWTLDLPAESFAAGPFGRLILVGADDGAASELSVIDVAAGCRLALGRSDDVIRRAVIDPAGTTIFEFRVDRATRVDLGVWRRDLGGHSAPIRLLEPLPPDDEFGPTFSTELGWSREGDRLAVQSCGARACRTRILEPRSGSVTVIAGPDHGELIGLTDGLVVAYAACEGLPCPIEGIDIATRARTVLAPAAGLAIVTGSGPDSRLVFEADGPAGFLAVRDLRTGEERTLVIREAGPRLMPAVARAMAGIAVPDGWIALADLGRASDLPGAPAIGFVRLADNHSAGPEEVLR